MNYTVGLSLGQTHEYSALAVLQTCWEEGARQPAYAVPYLARFPIGTPYPTISARLETLLTQEPLKGASLVVDGTGVGAAVVGSLGGSWLRPLSIVLTAGDTVTEDEAGGFRVPKKELAGCLQVLLQEGRLSVAKRLPEAALLVEELLNFRVKVTLSPGDVESWREKPTDDLVFAVGVAAWYADQAPKPNPLAGILIHGKVRGWCPKPLGGRLL
jgi:hypothetical protein